MSTILIADDCVHLLEAAKRTVADAGYDVLTTNTGADVLCLLAKKPDLLVLDIGMPVVNGYEVLRQLGPSAPPVVVITGGEIDLDEVSKDKVARVLLKPFDQTALLSAIRSALKEDVPNESGKTGGS